VTATVPADLTFACMGTSVRIIARDPAPARAFVEAAAARLTRFDPASELARLNEDARDEVPASTLLRTAVAAALAAAEATGGLVDPTLLDAVERAGYAQSRADGEPADLHDAVAHAPPRRPARPDPAARWRTVETAPGAIRRPPGLRLDLGGTAKGLIADLAVRLIGGDAVVDCGGDVRVGSAPRDVVVAHPFTGEPAAELRVRAGVATSGLARRIWHDGHHLIDPAAGRPAWTGLVAATALAPSAARAEALAKAALLSGPAGARAVLAGHGGVLVHDSGEVEVIA